MKSKLISLRQKYSLQKINKTQFFLHAAELYCDNNKPIRAKCLLNKVDSANLSCKQSIELIQLTKKVDNKIASHSQSNTCALTMIVKNEQDNIAGSLDSIESFMDEIVITDTGSTDNTIQYIELYGVTVIRSQWQDDFSLARNEAIDACTSRWIMWMDADDRFEEGSIKSLLNVITVGKKQGAAFCIVNERNNNTPVNFLQVRLFPRLDTIRFEQKIHEQIMYSLKRSEIPFSTHPEIRIRHLGYKNPDVAKKKAKRNIRLLHREIKNNPYDSILHMNLADCYFLIGKKNYAKKWYLRVVENRQILMTNPDAYNQSLINIALIYYHKNELDMAQSYLLQCLNSDSKRNDVYFYLGKIFLYKKDDYKALEYFQKSATIEPGLRMTPIDTSKIKLNSVYHISEILISKNLYNKSLNIINAAVAQYPNVPEFYSQMGKILARQNKFREAVYYLKISLQLNSSNNNEAMKVLHEIRNKINDPQVDRHRSISVFSTSKSNALKTY